MKRNSVHVGWRMFILLAFFLLMSRHGQGRAESLFNCPTLPPEVYPTPARAQYTDHFHHFNTPDGQVHLVLLAEGEDALRATRIFNRQLELMGLDPLPVVDNIDRRPRSAPVLIRFRIDKTIQEEKSEQTYAIQPVTENRLRIIEAVGGGPKGLMYAAAVLSQLVFLDQGQPAVREATITDRPAYGLRIMKTDPTPDDIGSLLDWMVRYRMSCLAIQGRKYAWWTVQEPFADLLDAYQRWMAEYGGVDLMIMCNLYVGQQIVIADPSHVQGLKDVIAYAVDRGASSLMLLADDTPPFKYGEGYILTDERDKARFQTMADAHCYLFQELRNWLDAEGRTCELFYAPAFYTYEEMHYGDMSLHVGTPWEEDIFGPFRRDHEIIGRDIPEDVFIVWCGPHVRSRRITEKDFEEWSTNFGGRPPFLWDNTIYSHHPFTTTTLFTAYDNELPEDFHLMTAGNGMFVNGDAATEIGRIPAMTVNDYLWNPDQYEPEHSLRRAITHLYGPDAVEPALDFQEAELSIRQMIGERLLWDEADSLWKVIRKTRFLTEKNPFYYHQNYGRLKALRFQLKYSVPEPGPSGELKAAIEARMRDREFNLERLESLGLTRLVAALRADMTSEDDLKYLKAIGAK